MSKVPATSLGFGKQVHRDVHRVFKWCREEGVRSVAYIMLAGPHERSMEDAVANVDNMLKLDADYAVFAVFSPYPGTDSFAEGAKMGLYEADCWDRMMKDPLCGVEVPVCWEEHLNRLEIWNFSRLPASSTRPVHCPSGLGLSTTMAQTSNHGRILVKPDRTARPNYLYALTDAPGFGSTWIVLAFSGVALGEFHHPAGNPDTVVNPSVLTTKLSDEQWLGALAFENRIRILKRRKISSRLFGILGGPIESFDSYRHSPSTDEIGQWPANIRQALQPCFTIDFAHILASHYLDIDEIPAIIFK